MSQQPIPSTCSRPSSLGEDGGELYSRIAATLAPLYGEAEARAIARLVLEEHCQVSMTDILLGHPVSNWDPTLLSRLQAGEPVQYVLGHTTFCGLTLHTDTRALIPRPETEGLVELVRQVCPAPAHVLDVCTGSGCIALALKHRFPEACVEAWDVSPEALALARENFALHNLNITVRQLNLLDEHEWPTAHGASPEEGDARRAEEVIVSNPPYVLDSERTGMQPHVLRHEPHLALFVPDDDPLLFYRPLARLARERLQPGGALIVECNTALTDDVARLFASYGLLAPTVHPDCFGRPRFVSAIQPEEN